MPRVSVIVPAYNCGRFLAGALESALAQTFKDREIIVVDDGSTDDTQRVIEKYSAQVQYFYQKNSGASAARNLAVSKSNGELLAYLDADDAWRPERLTKQVALIDEDPRCGLVHSDITVIDESDRTIHTRAHEENGHRPPQGSCALALLERNNVATTSVLERRDCFDRAGAFRKELPIAQDYYHWMQAALEGFHFGYISEPLGIYRWREGSVSSSSRRLHEDLVWIFTQVLSERESFFEEHPSARDDVRNRLYQETRTLAFIERTSGSQAQSVRRTLSLIREWPQSSELYFDLAKACIPEKVFRMIRSRASA